MAVLETIRTKFGVIITILIAVALLSFIVDPSSLVSAVNSSQNVVGKINGRKIDYMEYKDKVDGISALYSGNTSEEAQEQMQQMAWQYFLDREMFIPAATKAGFSVSENEMTELLSGVYMSPVLAQYFPNQTSDQIRKFIPELIAQTETNPQAAAFWAKVKSDVYDYQYHAKYNTLFDASGRQNTLTSKNFVDEANTVASVRFVNVPFGWRKDTTISVSKSEIKAYYDKYKSNYTQVASRDIEYVVFQLVPSEKDRSDRMAEFETLLPEFASCTDLSKFSKKKYLEKPEYYFKEGELNMINSSVNDFVFNTKNGTSEAIVSGDDIMAVKVVDTKNLPDSVYIQHIVFPSDKALADSLVGVINAKPSDFPMLAIQYSSDKNGIAGNWLNQSALLQAGIPEALDAKIDKAFTVEQNGTSAIFMVSKKTKAIEKKKVVMLKLTVYPSTATQNELYAQANKLSAAAGTSIEGLRTAASQQGLFLNHANITEASKAINEVANAREVTRWAFGAEVNAASSIIKAGQNYFVTALNAIHEGGISTLEEATPSIENKLYTEKRAAKVCEEIKSKIQGCTSIEQVAEVLATPLSSKEQVSFSQMYPQSGAEGSEGAFLGAVAGAKEGVVTGPVAGRFGAYVLVVDKRDTTSNYDAEMAGYYQARINAAYIQKLEDVMFEMTGSEDNRAHFF